MRLLDRARRQLDDALVVPGAGALVVLVGGDAEQQHRRDPERARPRPPPRRGRRSTGGRRRASPRSARALEPASTNTAGRSPRRPAASRARVPQDGRCGAAAQRVCGKGHVRMVRRLFPLLDAFRRSSPASRRLLRSRAPREGKLLAGARVPGRTGCLVQMLFTTPREAVSALSSIRSPRGSVAPASRAPRTAPRRTHHGPPRWSRRSPSPLRRPRRPGCRRPPVDPATQVPAWFQDGTGLKLGLLPLDGPPSALGAVGDFGLPDGEAFYWNAGADPWRPARSRRSCPRPGGREPAGGAARSCASAFITRGRPKHHLHRDAPVRDAVRHDERAGHRNRDGRHRLPVAPCRASPERLAARSGPSTWAPGDAAPPPGFVGDAATPHTVTGGTNGNRFTVSGGGLSLTTNEFVVAGKLAGPPVPVFHGPAGLDFGGQALGAPTTPQGATVTSFGVPDPAGASNLAVSGASVSGAAAADFHIVGSTCGAAMPSGAACAIGVQFVPSAAGPGQRVSTSRPTPPRVSATSHSGATAWTRARRPPPPRPPSGPGSGSRSSGRRTACSRARVLRRGLRLSMRLPQGAEIIKISVLACARTARSTASPSGSRTGPAEPCAGCTACGSTAGPCAGASRRASTRST